MDERAYAMRDALIQAIREQVGPDPVNPEALAQLRASFVRMLETAQSQDEAVSDMRYRALLAAEFDRIYQELLQASRS
ncbi:hypothetical protein IBL26_24535 [Roseomonas aerophila]|uniref:Uncharacterized protein n=1 Tax=Teichococcus aerophilus TaxID=1224513 RepID=A0ABR7RTP0_9PROT|nr:hypothetical protein [Pseudoroseomonas aerophila]MBC9210021.1 hypothetical protein [Pseudoroseomonas aerophila]